MCPYTIVNEDEILDPSFRPQDERSMIVRRAKHRTVLINQFVKRWREDYLLSLRERHTFYGSKKISVKVGDVVLIHHDQKTKLYWPLGVVTELHPGKDGLVRYVSLRTSQGITNRALNKLYPLEINHEFESQTLPVESNACKSDNPVSERPSRKAKSVAKKKIRNIAINQSNSDGESS